jgi:hypothetical protein
VGGSVNCKFFFTDKYKSKYHKDTEYKTGMDLFQRPDPVESEFFK